jgi:hypothetical protein
LLLNLLLGLLLLLLLDLLRGRSPWWSHGSNHRSGVKTNALTHVISHLNPRLGRTIQEILNGRAWWRLGAAVAWMAADRPNSWASRLANLSATSLVGI